jgi:hypothetical protein
METTTTSAGNLALAGRVRKMVAHLDTSADGMLSAGEVKVLFSRLLDIPEERSRNEQRHLFDNFHDRRRTRSPTIIPK